MQALDPAGRRSLQPSDRCSEEIAADRKVIWDGTEG